MPVLKFDQCDYNCHDKKDKRGSFRVYCRRVDPKCKTTISCPLTRTCQRTNIITKVKTTTQSVPTVHLHPVEIKYTPIIQQVIFQYPKHRVHGSQFFLVDNQFIADRTPTIQELKKYKEVISVHSHSASNWEKWTQKHGLEPFNPYSPPDVDILRKGLKNGWLTGEILIMADGRMDFLGISPRATREQILAFLNLGPKTIGRDLNLPEGERIETGEYPFARKRLRVFAAKYGLNFQEGLHWL